MTPLLRRAGWFLIFTSLPSILRFPVEVVEIATTPALGPQYFPSPSTTTHWLPVLGGSLEVHLSRCPALVPLSSWLWSERVS